MPVVAQGKIADGNPLWKLSDHLERMLFSIDFLLLGLVSIFRSLINTEKYPFLGEKTTHSCFFKVSPNFWRLFLFSLILLFLDPFPIIRPSLIYSEV